MTKTAAKSTARQEIVDVNAMCEALTETEDALAREIVSRLADKWSLWTLAELAHHGPLRFSRLMERVEGVSQKSLTSTLRHLERDGMVTRTVTAQVPIRVDYAVTPLGSEMMQQVLPLWTWAIGNVSRFGHARKRYDRANGTT